jgi:cephalosporin hydroxylase
VDTRVKRITSSAKIGLRHAENAWSTKYLAEQDARFKSVWEATSRIPGWFSQASAAAQFLILSELRPKRIVEIGSYQGKSTVFFAKSLEALGVDGKVTAIDPHSGDRQQLGSLNVSVLPSFEMFRAHIAACRVEEFVEPIVAMSHDAAKDWALPVEYLFVDGWHSYDAVMTDGEDWIPHLDGDGIVVFDDATRYHEVGRAVDDLAEQGLIYRYGDAFSQAFCGRRPDAPRSVRTILRAAKPITRHIPGL